MVDCIASQKMKAVFDCAWVHMYVHMYKSSL
jgi:hypothetical protein